MKGYEKGSFPSALFEGRGEKRDIRERERRAFVREATLKSRGRLESSRGESFFFKIGKRENWG